MSRPLTGLVQNLESKHTTRTDPRRDPHNCPPGTLRYDKVVPNCAEAIVKRRKGNISNILLRVEPTVGFPSRQIYFLYFSFYYCITVSRNLRNFDGSKTESERMSDVRIEGDQFRRKKRYLSKSIYINSD